MKKIALQMIAALMCVAALGGCGTVKHETAMEWMARQPQYIDP